MIRVFTLLNNIIAQPYVDVIKHWNLISPINYDLHIRCHCNLKHLLQVVEFLC